MRNKEIIIIIFFLALVNCSGPAKEFSIKELQKLHNPKKEFSIITPTKDSSLDSTGGYIDSISFEIEGLISLALSLCSLSDFEGADSVLVEALKKVRNYSDNISGDSVLYIDEWLRRIATIYCHNFPDTFTYPDDIATQVIELKINEAIDSLKISKEDSLFLAGFFNKSKVTYNIPMVWNSRVQRALYYYLTHRNSTVKYWGKRMRPYIGFIKKMIVDSGLPSDLSYLPIIESCFNPRALSRSYASGIWQFVKSTGEIYGLRTSFWFDERRDPVLSTKAAISYLKKLYQDFGDWHLALAAYNCGEGCVSRAIAKSNTSDYWKLSLPLETMNYVPLFLASLIITKNSEFPELQIEESDSFPFDTVYVKDCLDLKEIADFLETNYDTLKSINPHLLHWCTPPDVSDVLLYLPKGKGEKFRKSFLPLAEQKRVKWTSYKVKQGDNLLLISRKFGVDVEAIKSVNRMKNSKIIAGKEILLPISDKGNIALLQQAPTTKSKKVIPENATLIVYEVRSGDTMWKIAELFGVTVDEICLWNNLADNKIKAGDILSIYVNDESNKQPNKKSDIQKKERGETKDTIKHIVEKGENAFRISQKYSIPLDLLYSLNNINPNNPTIREGDTLLVIKNRQSQIKNEQFNKRKLLEKDSENYIKYIVSEGDNLFRISQNFSIDIETIKSINGLSSNFIRVGDTLIIPSAISNREDLQNSKEEIVYYTVKEGDTLWRIANTFGVSVDALRKYNGLNSDSVIMPGDKLKIVYQRGEM